MQSTYFAIINMTDSKPHLEAVTSSQDEAERIASDIRRNGSIVIITKISQSRLLSIFPNWED